jgi:hypothetical protein
VQTGTTDFGNNGFWSMINNRGFFMPDAKPAPAHTTPWKKAKRNETPLTLKPRPFRFAPSFSVD